MREAVLNGRVVVAGPDSPDVAHCPTCRAEVHKRRRLTMDQTVTWYYRHQKGSNKACPERYQFGS